LSDTSPSGSGPSPLRLIQRLLRLAWCYRASCLLVIALNLLLVAFQVGSLGLTGLGIDYLRHQLQPATAAPAWPLGWSPPAEWPALGVVGGVAGVVLALALLAAGLKYATAVASAALSQRVLVQLRSDVYDKLQRLSFDFFDAHQSSSLINRGAGDVQAVRVFVDGVLVKVVVAILTLSVYLAYMLSVHVPLTLLCLLTSPLMWCGAVTFSRVVQARYRRASQLVDDLILTLVENVQGQHVVKGFARQDDQIARFRDGNRRVHDQKRGIFWLISLYQPLMGLLTQLNMLILIGYGGWLVIRGQLLLGAGLFVFANLLQEFASQVGQVTNIANTIQTSLNGATRVFEVLDAPVEIRSPPVPVPLPALEEHGTRGRHVSFEGVSFAYRAAAETATSRMALDSVSLQVAPGECLGIVGETGAGKSTLLSLLARFYDVSGGTIRIDGIDIRQLELAELRRNIGIVFQDSFLFSNTVAANIAFGHPEATREEVRRAAELAAAAEFIQDLPEGYATEIGEYGANLSGGQRQRLAIARALLLDPPILVLDDATASVDPETENEIRTAMSRAMRGRTTLAVSNRVSTLRHADQVAVLHRGRVVQRGRPDALLRVSGPFRRLAELQFADAWDGESVEVRSGVRDS
jgi:ATP-binding cassette subfamily B protein